jgi:energy-coupling factor transporter ATP-binding protein EcfA2
VIEVNNLRKKYGDIDALKGVSFRVQAREIYGLLGPNGAGKSTTIGILCGLVTPDAGQASLNGIDIAMISRGFFESGRRMANLQGLNGLTVGVQRPGESEARTGFGHDPKLFFAYVFPGLVVFALMFIAQSLSIRLLRERESLFWLFVGPLIFTVFFGLLFRGRCERPSRLRSGRVGCGTIRFWFSCALRRHLPAGRQAPSRLVLALPNRERAWDVQ